MNYRNQTMNTNAGGCGISGRRRVRPDCGFEASVAANCGNTAQATASCGCATPVSSTCSNKTTCSAEAPASTSCGCVAPTPSCECASQTAPSCECTSQTTASCGCAVPPPVCGCKTSCGAGQTNCGCVSSGNSGALTPPFPGMGPGPVRPPFPPNAHCSNPSASDQLRGMPLAMAYVPWQVFCNLYGVMEGFHNGTIFKDLDLDFQGRRCN